MSKKEPDRYIVEGYDGVMIGYYGNAAERWIEHRTEQDGTMLDIHYLFTHDDITNNDGTPKPPTDYPWDDDHIHRTIVQRGPLSRAEKLENRAIKADATREERRRLYLNWPGPAHDIHAYCSDGVWIRRAQNTPDRAKWGRWERLRGEW